MPEFRTTRNNSGMLQVEDALIANCRCSDCRADDDGSAGINDGINEVSAGTGESPAAARLRDALDGLNRVNTNSTDSIPERHDSLSFMDGMYNSGTSGTFNTIYDEMPLQPGPVNSRSYREMVTRDREEARRSAAEADTRATDRVITTEPTPSASYAFTYNLHALAEQMLTEADSHPRAAAVKTARISSLRKTLADAYLLGVGKGYAKAAPAQEYSKMWRRLRDWGERELRHNMEDDPEVRSEVISELKAMLLRMEMMENEG